MVGKWVEKFPPMPTRRVFATAVCTGTVLIVAGGMRENCEDLTTVEVLNTENSQWSTAADLPQLCIVVLLHYMVISSTC